MIPDDSDPIVPVRTSFMRRLVDAIALASVGSYKEALDLLTSEEPGVLGEVTASVREIVEEIKVAVEQSNVAYDELMAQKNALQQRLRTIEQQQAIIRDLSTPIIDVAENVLAVPLVGFFDAARAIQLADRLLVRVVQTRAQWVIIDLTGVDALDLTSANHLFKVAQAAKLIGSGCLVTGLRPEVAQSFVSQGIALGDLTPMQSLKEGLRYCSLQMKLANKR